MGKARSPARRPQQSSKGAEITAIHQEEYSGPLPHPNILQQYEDIAPGFAERIIASWEKETAHRHELEKRVVSAEIEGQQSIAREVRRGQYLAFSLSVLFLAVGGSLAYFGKEVSGSILGGTGFIGTITSFLTTAFQSRNKQPRNNHQDK
jgi:uncharacterized membrane protein